MHVLVEELVSPGFKLGVSELLEAVHVDAHTRDGGKVRVVQHYRGLGQGSKRYALKIDPKKHGAAELAGKVAFVPSASGKPEANERGRRMHRAAVQMQKQFPAVAKNHIEVVPSSALKGSAEARWMKFGKVPVAAMPLEGGFRLIYNDGMGEIKGLNAKIQASLQPYVQRYENFEAWHEMGHVLAMTSGDQPVARENSKPQEYLPQMWNLHKQRFAKHGLTFEELATLSPYAASAPQEALAELAGLYFTPEARSQLSPELAKKAEAMFNEMGGRS